MNEQKDKTVKLMKIFLILMALGIVVISVYLESTGTNIINIITDYRAKGLTAKVKENINFEIGSNSNFAILKNSYVQCTKDGVKYFGSSSWNETYTMTSPVMISEGNIIAVGEFKNRSVYIFNEKGKMYNIQTELPIEQFAINKLGYLVVIMKDVNMYKINLYNSSGKILLERNEENEGVYPISADISNDGTYMAISYLDTLPSSIKYTSRILFFSINNEEQYIDSIKGNVDGSLNIFNATLQKKDEIIFDISYIDNNILLVVSDKSITAINDNSTEIWVKTLTNELTSLDSSDGKTIVIGLGKKLPGGSDYESGTAVWYDLSGKELGFYKTGKKIELLTCKSNRVIVYSGKKLYGLNKKGTLIWEYVALQDVIDMMLFDDLSNVLVVYKNSAQIVYTKSKQNDDENKETKEDKETNNSESLENKEETSESLIEESQVEDTTNESEIVKDESETAQGESETVKDESETTQDESTTLKEGDVQ